MWATLGKFLASNIIKPLIEKYVKVFVRWLQFLWSERKRKAKLKKDNKKKVKAYEESSTENDDIDTFSNLP